MDILKVLYTLWNKDIGAYQGYHFETEVSMITDFLTGVKNAVLTEDIKSALLKNLLPATAAAHNSIYRGKDLTAYWDSGEMSKAIKNGTFDDIFPGDYIIKDITVGGTKYSQQKFLVADLDYYLHRGDVECVEHHVVIVPEKAIGTSYMNSTNTTAGGYPGSYMFKTTIPKYVTAYQSTFGTDHILKHRDWIPDAVNNDFYSGAGAGFKGSTYWTNSMWRDITVSLMTESMVYGAPVFSSSGYDTGCCNKQLAIFRYGQNFGRDYWFWLRNVANSTNFANASVGGDANYYGASGVGGVRPYSLLR